MIDFPRPRQDYQGVLWSEGKNVIAGTLTMLGRDFSFVAVREGTRLDLDGAGAARRAHAARTGGNLAPGPGRGRSGPISCGQGSSEIGTGADRAPGACLQAPTPSSRCLIVAGESTPLIRVCRRSRPSRPPGSRPIHLAPAAVDP